MAENAIYAEIKSLVRIKDSPAWGDYDRIERALVTGEQALLAALVMYRGLRGTALDQAELREAIELFYADYIEPINLPHVGPVIEGLIDAQGAKLLSSLVKQLDAWLDAHQARLAGK